MYNTIFAFICCAKNSRHIVELMMGQIYQPTRYIKSSKKKKLEELKVWEYRNHQHLNLISNTISNYKWQKLTCVA